MLNAGSAFGAYFLLAGCVIIRFRFRFERGQKSTSHSTEYRVQVPSSSGFTVDYYNMSSTSTVDIIFFLLYSRVISTQ